METPDAHVEREICAAAAALPAEERAAYLEATCAGRLELRANVEAWLGAHEPSDFMQAADDELRVHPEQAGEQIGNYKLLEKIGEGGFGVVWVADQERPVRRRVALKIIKLGMDTKEVIARFGQERQALAMMEHPHIAKVLEAGSTERGRPYFVMELVRGIKITDYCDQANLPTADRLALFIQVCSAVQHAHQKGIIHRDLKPSNILVTLHDGVPVPKVIDFGVAKATQQQRLTDLTIYTQFEQMIGTPLYMSPEQAEMSGLDVDTRSDIYSLGVLLYELLTGRTPFDPAELMRKDYDEIRHAIREQEPLSPSTFIRTMPDATRATVAQHRNSDPAKLTNLVRGDLDWIVMKALEKDRTRRYETANGLAMDIKRHLANEPVLARPPSQLYRVRRLVRRNRLAVAAGGAIAAAVLVGLVFSTLFFFREKEARLQATATLAKLKGTAPTFEAQARALLDEGKMDGALTKIEFATDLSPENPDYRLFRANLLEAVQRLSEAVVDYKTVLALRPGDAVAGKNLALCEHLLAKSGGQPLSPELQKELLGSLLAQKRLIEAAPLNARFAAEFAETDAVLRTRLKDYISQAGWNDSRIRRGAQGYYSLDLSELVITDLSKLSELPIICLNVSKTNLTDLRSVRQLPLTCLHAGETGVTDLTPLAGMKLTHLDLFRLKVSDISALADMPLKVLSLHSTMVSDLGPLDQPPLEQLDIQFTPCTDLSPLAGLPLRILNIESTKCKDLSALARLPLREFHFENTPVDDLTPLHGLPLDLISISSEVTDLAPLSGLPLRTFHARRSRNLSTLRPLLDCLALESVILPKSALDVILLRGHPTLKSIDIQADKGGAYATEGPFAIDDFWKRFSAKYERRAELMEVATRLRKLPAERHWNKRPEEIVQINDDNTLTVSLHHTDLADLSLFRGLPVKRLDIGDTRVTDLSDLRGSMVQFLGITGTPVADLEPLRGLPLRTLTMERCDNVRDVSPLADCSELEAILLPKNAVNVETLRQLPKLRRLGRRWSGIHDDFDFVPPVEEFWEEYNGRQKLLMPVLALLPKLGIKDYADRLSVEAGGACLTLNYSDVTDLSSIVSLPIDVLHTARSKVTDLSPLRGMRLKVLTFDDTAVTDVSPLLDMPILEAAMVTQGTTNVELLRDHSTLKYLGWEGADWDVTTSRPKLTTAAFWARFEAKRRTGEVSSPPEAVLAQKQNFLDLEKLMRLRIANHVPESRMNWLKLGVATGARGDRAEYRRVCADMWQNYKDDPDPSKVETAAKVCILLADSGIEPAEVTKRLAKIPAVGADWYFGTYGLAEYRAQRYEEAVKLLLRAKGVTAAEAVAAPVLAMAHYQLKSPAAKAALERARELIGPHWPGSTPDPKYWQDWLTAYILLQEAERLFGGGSPDLQNR
ncbi:MAG: protein kinase [Verrucomicrobiota bacterium]